MVCGHVVHAGCWVLSPCLVCHPQRVDLMAATAVLSAETVLGAEPVGQTPPEECSICLDPLSIGGSIALRCGHRFHATCVSRLDGAQRRCAMCRADGFPSQQSLKDSVYAENMALRAMIEEMQVKERIVMADMVAIVDFVENETVQRNDAVSKLDKLSAIHATLQSENELLQSDSYFLRDEVDLLREQQQSFVTTAAQLAAIASELVDESAGLVAGLGRLAMCVCRCGGR